MRKKRICFIIAIIMLGSIFLMACNSDASAMDKYVNKDLENIQVEKNIDDLNTRLQDIMKKMQSGTKNDQNQVTAQMDKIIVNLQDKKKEIEGIKIENAKVKEANSLLIKTYAEWIEGFQGLSKGIKEKNRNEVNDASKKMEQAQTDIKKWGDLVQGKEK